MIFRYRKCVSIAPVVVLVVVIAGCALPSSSASGPKEIADGPSISQPTGSVFRGHFVFGHEVRTFQTCGSANPVWVEDDSRRLWPLHGELAPLSAPYQAVFGVVRGTLRDEPGGGFGRDYRQRLVVTDIEYMAREGFGCELDWSGFAVRAYGNEPWWSIAITQFGVRFRRPGDAEQVWNDVGLETDGAVQHYRRKSGERGAAELQIVRSPCRDAMSGAFFARSAELRLGGEVFRGCALPGEGKNPLGED